MFRAPCYTCYTSTAFSAAVMFPTLLPLCLFRVCLHGSGGSQVGEVTRGGLPHLLCKCDQILIMRDYMDRWLPHLNGLGSPTSMQTGP